MNFEEMDSHFTTLQNVNLKETDRRKKGQNIPIPTDDKIVKKCLRSLQEPIILFGEDPYQRRERLGHLLNFSRERWSREELANIDRIIKLPISQIKKQQNIQSSLSPFDNVDKTDTDKTASASFTSGPEDLKEIRREIAKISLLRSKMRLEAEKDSHSKSMSQVHMERKAFYSAIKNNNFNILSQVAGDRPLSSIAYSSDGSFLITGSWDGIIKTWDSVFCELLPSSSSSSLSKKYHDSSRICSISSNPAFPSVFASSDLNGRIILWQDQNVNYLSGHQNRVSGLSFDPTGKFLSSSGYDMSWRLWDVGYQKELQVQYGHSQPIQCLAFHVDGAIVATGSLDSHVNIWDIRIGSAIWTLKNHHIKAITSIDFSFNGFNIATGSEDDTIGIWDMRQLKCTSILPAHTSIITKVKYSKNGLVLLSSSYDKTVKIWSVHGWDLLTTLESHDGKIMSMDINQDNDICTAGYDRTFKIWSNNKSKDN